MFTQYTDEELTTFILSPVGDYSSAEYDATRLEACLNELAARRVPDVSVVTIGGRTYEVHIRYAPTRWRLDREEITLVGPRGGSHQVLASRDGSGTYFVARAGKKAFLPMKIDGAPVLLRREGSSFVLA